MAWALRKIAYRSESPEPVVVKKVHAYSGRDSWEERRFASYDFNRKAAQLAVAARALPQAKVHCIELTAMLKQDVPELNSFKPWADSDSDFNDQDFSSLICSGLER